MSAHTHNDVTPEAQLTRLLDRIERIGNTPAALWPASDFLASLAPMMRDARGILSCVIDDNPALQGKTFAGLEVVSLEQALAQGVRAVVACATGPLQDTLFESRGPIRASGVQLLWCPGRFSEKPWDRALCDLWDHEQALANGKHPAWRHAYPPEHHRAPTGYAGYLRDRLGSGPGGRILEVGSGHGLITAELIGGADSYQCVDFSERLLFEIIEHRFCEHLGKLTLHHDESATLSAIPDDSIDLALSFDVFVHLHPDLVHQYLASFKRVLAPGGRICLHVRTWDRDEIRVWEESYRDGRVGKWNYMGYNTLETLGASADHLGLELVRVGDDDGKSLLEGWTGYLVEFTSKD